MRTPARARERRAKPLPPPASPATQAERAPPYETVQEGRLTLARPSLQGTKR